MQNLKLLSKIAQSFQNTDTFDEKVENTLKDIGEFMDVSRVYIYFYETKEILKNTFEWCNEGVVAKIHNIKDVESEKILSWVNYFNDEGYISIDDISVLPSDIIKNLEPYKVKSLIVYPLIIGEEVKGFIGAEESKNKRKWKNEEKELLNTVAGMIANSYEKNFLKQDTISSENNFRNFFETIDDMFIVSDLKGDIIHCNKSLVVKSGYSFSELKGMNILDLHPKGKKEKASVILSQLLKGEKEFCSLEIENKDGTIYLVETRIWIGKWNRQECIFSISKDITKETENLELFSKIFEDNPLPMIITTKDEMRFTKVNPKFLNMLGFSKEEVIGKTVKELDIFISIEKFKKDKIKNTEFKIRCKDGSFLNMMLSVEPINIQGKKSFLTAMVDITEIVNLTEDVHEKLIKLTNVIEGTNLGTWEWNIKTGHIEFNEQWANMIGYTLKELEPIDSKTWERFVHPEGFKKSNVALQKHLNNETENYSCEIRMKHKDGRWIWVQDRGKIVERDEDGKAVKMFGTHLDITEEQEKSLELERIFTVNLDLLCILDMEGYFIKVNKAWDDILGYSSKELKDQNITEFIYKDDIEITIEAMKKLEYGEKVDCFVNRYNDVDGKCHYLEWRAKPYEGLVYASARDITERVEYENKILDISNKDALTNVYNRRYVFNKAEEIINKYKSKDEIFSVCILDIDYFKKINDTYGHATGDCVLKEFTKTIGGNLRLDDILGRYGGEEFIVILVGSDKKEGKKIIEAILEIVREKTFLCNGNEIKFTFSAGISTCEELKGDKLSIDNLVDLADQKMYQAKNTGRNRIVN